MNVFLIKIKIKTLELKEVYMILFKFKVILE